MVWSLASAAAPGALPTAPVLVALRDLGPGTVITSTDVRVENRAGTPVDSLPDGGEVIGRTVAFPVRAGEALLARHVLGADLLAGYPAGTVAMAIPVSDASSVPALAAGDLVDVIAATSADLDTLGAAPGTAGGAVVVARGVHVLLGDPGGPGDGGLLGAGSARSSALVVAASAEQALAIARAGVRARLTVVLRGRT